MDNQKEVLPIRIIAARFISADELEGLSEIDRITADVYRLVYWQYIRLWIAFTAALFATVIVLLPGIGFSLIGVRGGDIVMIIGLVPFSLLLGIFGRWRILQYGGMTARTPQTAVYANPDDPAARNLERLFTVFQLETTPRAFYLMKNGLRRYIGERHFFGTLRAALVSKEQPLRDMFLAPAGLWFPHEIFMETNVEVLIAQAKAKPKRAGPLKTYDYSDAIMSLIEHPVVRTLQLGTRGNHTKIVGLLRDWYRFKRTPAPSDNQLSLYAKTILEMIAKNRAANL